MLPVVINKIAPICLRSLRVVPVEYMVSKRGIRGVHAIFREKLPRYKRNLKNLPPLTQLLTEPIEHLSAKELAELRQAKLAVYKEYLPVDATTTLLESLLNPDNDIDALLNIIDENLVAMTSFYLGVSFEAIDDIMRAKLCDPSTVAVSPEFDKLCTKTLTKLRFFEADEVLKLIKCLSSLRAPEDALIVQAALQMARHLINDFNEEELDNLTSALTSIQPRELEQGCGDKSLLSALKKVKIYRDSNKLLT